MKHSVKTTAIYLYFIVIVITARLGCVNVPKVIKYTLAYAQVITLVIVFSLDESFMTKVMS